MKGQDKTPEKQLNEVEIGKLPERKFRIMMVKMIQDLRKTMEKMQEMFNKDLEEQKNKDEYSRRNQWWETEAEEHINDLEDRMGEITATEQNTEKRKEMETA